MVRKSAFLVYFFGDEYFLIMLIHAEAAMN